LNVISLVPVSFVAVSDVEDSCSCNPPLVDAEAASKEDELHGVQRSSSDGVIENGEASNIHGQDDPQINKESGSG